MRPRPRSRPPNCACRQTARLAAALAAAAALGACAVAPEGADIGEAYAKSSEILSADGRFRRDVAPEDAPYDADDLLRNFLKVAYEPESQLARYYPDRFAARRLVKWTGPIRYRLRGDGVRAADRETVARLAARLGLLSNLSIAELNEGDDAANLQIFVLSPDARAEIHAREKTKAYYADSIFREWISELGPPCFALLATEAPNGGAVRSAAIYLKAEVDDPWRESCLVEEMAQALGLPFDHAEIRPSIFNDDQEFLALTDHDARLIEILYDPRLRPGASRVEAAPILREILFGDRAPRR